MDKYKNLLEDIDITTSELTDIPEKVSTHKLTNDIYAGGYFTLNDQSFEECFHMFRINKLNNEINCEAKLCLDRSEIWKYAPEQLANWTKRLESKGKAPLKSNFYFHSAILNSDQSITYLIEQNYSLENTNDGLSITSNIFYKFGSILAINVDTEGNIIWESIIPKYQFAVGRLRLLSFKSHVKEDGTILLVFNASIEERLAKLKVVELETDGTVSTLMDYTIPSKMENVKSSQINENIKDYIYFPFVEKKQEGVIRVRISD